MSALTYGEIAVLIANIAVLARATRTRAETAVFDSSWRGLLRSFSEVQLCTGSCVSGIDGAKDRLQRLLTEI